MDVFGEKSICGKGCMAVSEDVSVGNPELLVVLVDPLTKVGDVDGVDGILVCNDVKDSFVLGEVLNKLDLFGKRVWDLDDCVGVFEGVYGTTLAATDMVPVLRMINELW